MSGPDAQSLAVLAERAAAGGRPMREAPVAQSRAAQWEWVPYMGEPAEVAAVEDRLVGSGSAEIPVRIYTTKGEGPFPALVAFHGGCWMVGSIEIADGPHRALAAETGCVVVAVDYRKAPEHPFPVPLEDCAAGFAWTVAHAEELGVDAARIGVVGDSAGGNLAAAVCLKALADGGRMPATQVLIYPALDWRLDTPSAREYSDGYGLTTEDMRWTWHQYAPEAQMLSNPLVSPMQAPSLAGLPPAIVVTAECDILRDEGQAYSERLAADGVATVLLHYPGAIHGFLWMQGAVDACGAMLSDIAAQLRAWWR